MANLPAGTVTFLFTDIEGSAALWETDRLAMPAVMARHDELLAEAMTAQGGHRYKHVGDAMQAAFATAGEALAAAVAAQRALLAETWPLSTPVRVRMALHTGEAVPDHSGDYHQVAALNRLSRILAVAHGSQIVLSQATRDLVSAHLSPQMALRDLGEHRLRDLLEPERIWQVLAPELPQDFPPLRSLTPHLTNLPIQLTPLVGRDADIAAIQDLITQEQSRLVTLIGPGGTGKTRLALAVAAELLDAFPDGVWFVDLSPLADPALVLPAIASVLGVRETTAMSLTEPITAFVASRRLLLVLDNFEHLLDAATLVSELLRSTPTLTIVATSREPLHLRGEREVAVAPLAVPAREQRPILDELVQVPAVALFVQRARAAKADFALSADNAAAVSAICRRLDGLPLAIELAAARVKILPPSVLLSRLERSLPLLTSGPRDAPTRQRALRDAIAWSYDLLSPDEQRVFRQIGVFAGGFTLEAAEVIVDDDRGRGDLFEVLASLTDKSLLRQQEGKDDELRFMLLETVREFSLERLAETDDGAQVRQRHAAYFLALTERAAAIIMRPLPGPRIARLEAEHPNFRAALDWLDQTGDTASLLRFVGSLSWFWFLHDHLVEGRQWLERALTRADETPTPARVRALLGAAYLARVQGDFHRALRPAEEAVATAREVGDETILAEAVQWRGMMAWTVKQHDQAESLLAEALSVWRRSGNDEAAAAVLDHLALVKSFQGDLAQAAGLAEEALAIQRRAEDPWGTAFSLSTLGWVLIQQGLFKRAAAVLSESLALNVDVGNKSQIAWCLTFLARLAGACGRPESAARLLGAEAALRTAVGVPIPPAEEAEHEQAVGVVRAALGEAAFASAWVAGEALSLEHAVAEAQTLAKAIEGDAGQ